MNIVYLSPEVWPFGRVGGLAEVSHDLPLALGARGHQVSVITILGRPLPQYEDQFETLDLALEVPVAWRRHQAEVRALEIAPGVKVFLLRNDALFDRDGLYGNAFGQYEDNAERFIFYSRACLELAQALGRPVDLVHCNDWTTGLVPAYLKTLHAGQENLKNAASLMTIHNLANQGSYWHYDMPLTGLGWELFTPEGIEFYGKINFLKAALIYADLVSTVSPSYAREIRTSEMGEGLQEVLNARKQTLAAVINGVDYRAWDPSTDSHLAARYTAEDLSGKEECRRDLRRIFGLPPDQKRPLLAVVGRLQRRKGLDLILEGLESLVNLGLDLIIAGYGGDHYHTQLKNAAYQNPQHVGVIIANEMHLDHKVLAGADMLLMPSSFEPCGLHQMHAMRYGTIPVVRATGGLQDTVKEHTPENPGVGFLFGPHTTKAMLEAVGRALGFYADRAQWEAIMRRAMALDFSWERAAGEYEQLYQRAMARRAGEGEGPEHGA